MGSVLGVQNCRTPGPQLSTLDSNFKSPVNNKKKEFQIPYINLVAANLGHKAKTGLRTLREFTEKIDTRNVDMVFCLQTTIGDDKKQRYHRCHVLKQTVTMSVKMKLRVCRDVDSKMLFGSMPVIAGVISEAKGNWTCWRCY